MDNSEESIFEIRYEQNGKYVRDVMKYFHFKRPFRIVFFGIVLIMIAVLFALGRKASLFPAVIYTAFILFWIPFAYFRGVKVMETRLKVLGGGNPVIISVYVSTAGIRTVCSADKSDVTIPPSSIKGVTDAGSFVIVKTDGRLLYAFPEDGFVKGTPDELVRFLKDITKKTKD